MQSWWKLLVAALIIYHNSQNHINNVNRGHKEQCNGRFNFRVSPNAHIIIVVKQELYKHLQTIFNQQTFDKGPIITRGMMCGDPSIHLYPPPTTIPHPRIIYTPEWIAHVSSIYAFAWLRTVISCVYVMQSSRASKHFRMYEKAA